MEQLSENTRNRLRNCRMTFTALLLAAACAACGPQIIEGRPPFLRISEMNMVNGTLAVDFDISNPNEVEMKIDAIEVEVNVGDIDLVHSDPAFTLTVGASSTEILHVTQPPPDGLQTRLDALDNGDIISLPFNLSGRVHTIEDGYLEFDQKGHLYPVPGKPGYYRSAVTQSKELQRENPF